MPAVPLHEGHEIDKNAEGAQRERESEVAFAAFALPVATAIAHDQTAGIAGSPSSFSTISEANSAVI